MAGCYRTLFIQTPKQNLNHRGEACGSEMTESVFLKTRWHLNRHFVVPK